MKATPHYPFATLAFYGPDYRTPRKVVVGIYKRPSQIDPVALQKWVVETGDIRQNSSVNSAVAEFTRKHHVAETVTTGKVQGCIHEEGVDYPRGGICPQCPFWANLDRLTLEPLSPEAPLTPEQLFAGLAIERNTQPLAVLEAVERHRERMVEPFAQVVERVLQDPAGSPEADQTVFSYALAFLVKWKDPHAFPLIIRWLSLPRESSAEIGGDTITEWGARMLASVCPGDLAPIKQLIEDRTAGEFGRGQAIKALAVLAAWGEQPVAEVADYFGWLLREGLEREVDDEGNDVWDHLGQAVIDIEATEVFDGMRRLMEEGTVPFLFLEPNDLTEAANAPRGWRIAQFRKQNERFQDVAKETEWWSCFSKDDALTTADEPWPEPELYQPETKGVPYVAPPKIGRNDPCPCGSGNKYKKCCGR